jgi:hypothetical protein
MVGEYRGKQLRKLAKRKDGREELKRVRGKEMRQVRR